MRPAPNAFIEIYRLRVPGARTPAAWMVGDARLTPEQVAAMTTEEKLRFQHRLADKMGRGT